MAICSPNWTRTLRRASFRGAAFFVEHDDVTYGRRIKTHEFPNRDRPFQEDLGEKAIDFKVTAYVASDAVLFEKDRLVAACRQRGAATLQLPSESPQRAVCFECKRTHAKDKLGYIAFDLHFGEAGNGFGTITAALLGRLVALAGGGAIAAIGLSFAAAFNTVRDTTWVISGAISTVRVWTALVDGQRLGMRTLIGTDTSGADGASLGRSIGALYADARTLALGGPGLNNGRGTLTGGHAAQYSDLPARVAEIMGEIRLAAASPTDAITALRSIGTYDYSTINPAEALSTSALAEYRNEVAIGELFRRAALVELAIAMTEATYPDRRAAIQARADIVELLGREMASADAGTYQALDAVRGKVAAALSASIADLRPTITIEADASHASLVWAYRLYGDVTKADALVRRNRVRHPALMPVTFEAEAT